MRNVVYLTVVWASCIATCIGQINITFGPIGELSKTSNGRNTNYHSHIRSDESLSHLRLNYYISIGYRLSDSDELKAEYSINSRKRGWNDFGFVGYDEVEFRHIQYRLLHSREWRSMVLFEYGLVYERIDELELYQSELDIGYSWGCNSITNGIAIIGRLGLRIKGVTAFLGYQRGVGSWSKGHSRIKRFDQLTLGMTYTLELNIQ